MAMITGRRVNPQLLYDAGIIHALALDSDSLDKAADEFLDDVKLAAPQAASLCKMMVREVAGGRNADIDRMAGEVFATMLAHGSESSHGIAQFNRGLKI